MITTLKGRKDLIDSYIQDNKLNLSEIQNKIFCADCKYYCVIPATILFEKGCCLYHKNLYTEVSPEGWSWICINTVADINYNNKCYWFEPSLNLVNKNT